MKKFVNRIRLLFFYFYSLLFCIRYLPIVQAWHIPILIHPSVKVDSLYRGGIKIIGRLKPFMFTFGFAGTLGQSNCRSRILIKKEGRLILRKNVIISQGGRIVINNGEMSIGENFFCNGDCYFYCTKK